MYLFALAQTSSTTPETESWEKTLQVIFDAVRVGNWRLVAAGIVLLTVWMLRKHGSSWFPGLRKGSNAFILSISIGAAGALANAILGGLPISGIGEFLSLLIQGAQTGLVASGIYSGVKKLAEKDPPPPTPLKPL